MAYHAFISGPRLGSQHGPSSLMWMLIHNTRASLHVGALSREQHLVQLALPYYHMQCALNGALLNRFPQLQRLDLSWNSVSGRYIQRALQLATGHACRA